ncbi:hypothetical protein SAY86_024525 [Trapa natans]|uniref:Uncharacterized protein n=1 Tax=Trapa natans TaxID=22666 RepID=A0AAN7REF0_TRANT|nr:hypothetical protein SAY86_024525 [Trapa natans]
MEQRKSGSSNESSSGIGKEDDAFRQMMGSLIHSQVRKIKREEMSLFDWTPGQPELRPAIREITRQISRSPLGLSGMPISVGDM